MPFLCLIALVSSSPIAQIYPGYGASPYAPYAVAHAPLAVAHAPYVHAAPLVKHVVPEPVDPNPHYSFSYGVSDHHTGDNKQAEETLVNGVVHGSYSLQEPDGTIRKVTYTADKINGFNAVVEKHGVAHHVAPKVVAAPLLAHAAPALVHSPVLAAPAYGGYYH